MFYKYNLCFGISIDTYKLLSSIVSLLPLKDIKPLAIYTYELHIAPKPNETIRLQDYGVGIFKGAPSKSALKKAIKRKQVLVNGKLATTAMFIKEGDKIELRIPLGQTPHKTFQLELQSIFEDEHMAIVHKPAGVLTSGNSFKTIANALPNNLKTSSEADAILPQPAHRLDFATTGALTVGKTRKALHKLNMAFEKQQIKKVYYAICIGHLPEYGTIDVAIDGKDAKTYYRAIESVNSPRFGQLQLVQLLPITGRRHQLRKHLFAMGSPILGDPIYYNENHILKGKGLYLHAYSLKLQHPETEENLWIVDPLPERFRKIIDCDLPNDFLLR